MIALVTNVSSMGTFLYPNWHGHRGRFLGTRNTHLKYKRAIKRGKVDAFSSARAAATSIDEAWCNVQQGLDERGARRVHMATAYTSPPRPARPCSNAHAQEPEPYIEMVARNAKSLTASTACQLRGTRIAIIRERSSERKPMHSVLLVSRPLPRK